MTSSDYVDHVTVNAASLKVVVFAPGIVGQRLGHPRHQDAGVDEVHDLYKYNSSSQHL